MNCLLELIAIMAYALGWGLRKGSVVCATICAPGLIPYVAEKEGDWKAGLKAGIIFNLPRIVLLVLLGVIVGYVSFAVVNMPEFERLSANIGHLGYLSVGVLLFLYGGYNLAKTIDRIENVKEFGDNWEEVMNCSAPHSKAVFRMSKRLLRNRNNTFLLVWGSLLGMACVGETIIAIESALLGGYAASFSESGWSAGLFGGIVMFSFAIGASIPVIFVTTAAGKLSKNAQAGRRMLQAQLIGSGVMILIGIILLFMSITYLI